MRSALRKLLALKKGIQPPRPKDLLDIAALEGMPKRGVKIDSEKRRWLSWRKQNRRISMGIPNFIE
jgi:hypothetical protein